ncbi:MAG: phage portal protein [Candidatus Caldarchaeum sp.]
MPLFRKTKQAPGTVLWFSRSDEVPDTIRSSPANTPIIVAVVETIAAACDAAEIMVQSGEELLKTHSAIDLIRRPNPNANVGLLYFMSMLWDFYGEVVLAIDEVKPKVPVIWPLEPQHIVKRPANPGDKWVVSFKYGTRAIPPENIVHIVRPFPGSLYAGRGWLIEALSDEIQMLEALTRYLRAWFTNNGIPPLIVSAQGIDEEQISRYEQRWLEKVKGFSRRLVPFFVRGKPDIVKLDNTPPGELPAFYRIFRDAIFQAFGVPPEIMGIVENSNRATAEAAHLIFAKYRIRPRVETFVSALQPIVERYWGVRLTIGALEPEDKEGQRELLTKNQWIATLNEHRIAAGLAPIEGGDVFLAPQPVVEAH